MGLTSPAIDPDLRRDLAAQVAPLGVESAERILEVREPGSVLDVEQRRPLDGPGNDVRPARELVVLVRLVDSN